MHPSGTYWLTNSVAHQNLASIPKGKLAFSASCGPGAAILSKLRYISRTICRQRKNVNDEVSIDAPDVGSLGEASERRRPIRYRRAIEHRNRAAQVHSVTICVHFEQSNHSQNEGQSLYGDTVLRARAEIVMEAQ